MRYTEGELSAKLSYYQNLPEKMQRHFLATEYASLGKGSQRYLSEVFGCCRKRITRGTLELKEPGARIDYTQQRLPGGGRKKKSG
jgi:hypothetical protein